MKKHMLSILAVILVLLTLAGCGAAEQPSDTGTEEETTVTEPVEQEEPAEPEEPEEPETEEVTEAVEEELEEEELKPGEYDFGDFKLVLGEPSVVAQGEPGDQIWGHYQFPDLWYTPDNNIAITWDYGTDNIKYDGVFGYSVSTDQGKTWQEPDGFDIHNTTYLMPNGKYFVGFTKKGAHVADYIDAYEPAVKWGAGNALYFKDEITETEDTFITASEWDPVTGETTTFDVTVNWPYAPLVKLNNMVYPFTQMFCMGNRNIKIIDGEMYLCMYFYGFDSAAASKEEAVMKYSHLYSCYVFKSADSGRTWDYLSQISVDEDTYQSGMEGLCEPLMEVMEDGSIVMLMRTGSLNPSYIARSTDKCLTWSEPEKFDFIGVLPQLLRLPCGVTIATYGRPMMHMNATNDPTGVEWGEPVEIPLTAGAGTAGAGTSCYYTDLLLLDDNTVLWAYTDFRYPNPDGKPVKTILTRTITVVPKS